MTYTPEQRSEMLRLHGMWLRNEAGGKRANLSGADLSDANLLGADLRDANLRGADLRDADLRDADIRGADFRSADLSGADIRGANLSGADLSDANLLGADLRDANLRGADLSGANLRDANLRGADLSGAILRGAGCCYGTLGQYPVVVTTTHIHVGCVRLALADIPADDDAAGWAAVHCDAPRWWGLYGGVVRAMIAAAQADCAAQAGGEA